MTTRVSADIGSEMDALPFTRLHGYAMLVCLLAMICALSEISLSSALSAIFSVPPAKASSTELSLLLSSVYLGAIIGAPLFGAMADRFGRRTLLIGSMAWMAATSAAAGYTHTILQLTLCRGLTGMALGALPPIVISLLADVLPPYWRGTATLWCVAVSAVGPTSTLLFLRAAATTHPMGMDAWRLCFLVLSLACCLVVVGAVLLPESPRFLAVRGRLAEAERALRPYKQSGALLPVRQVQQNTARAGVQPAGTFGQRGLIYVLFALSPWATVAVPLLAGAVLAQRGFALNDALLMVGLANMGQLLGNVLGSAVIDRVDRRHCLALCCVVMAAAGGIFVTSVGTLAVVLGAGVFWMAASIYVTTLTLYTAELFPTRTRSRHLARAWAVNRCGAAVAPFLLVPLLRNQGAEQMFAWIVVLLGLSIAALYRSPHGRQQLGLA